MEMHIFTCLNPELCDVFFSFHDCSYILTFLMVFIYQRAVHDGSSDNGYIDGAWLLGHMSDIRVELNRCLFPRATSGMLKAALYMTGEKDNNSLLVQTISNFDLSGITLKILEVLYSGLVYSCW